MLGSMCSCRGAKFVAPRQTQEETAARQANAAARQTFLRYILKTCGVRTAAGDFSGDYNLIGRLPDVVREAMKCKGFTGIFKSGDWKASNQRPLTSRRIAAGADGVYHLEIDEIPVTFRKDGETGRLVTQGEVAYAPGDERKHLWRILMESMYLWGGTDGASFVVEPASDRLLLQRADPLAETDADGFIARLDAFVATAVKWWQLVADFQSALPATD